MKKVKYIIGKIIKILDLKTKKVRYASLVKNKQFKFKNVLVHDRIMNSKLGDTVSIYKSRKISKNKYFLIENFYDKKFN